LPGADKIDNLLIGTVPNELTASDLLAGTEEGEGEIETKKITHNTNLSSTVSFPVA
jgi:hypothetical protein